MNEVFPNIYKKDSKGKTRVWSMELDGDQYRTISGVLGGNLIVTEWTTAVGKNIGKANETSGEEQALNEIESQYKKKLSVDYHDVITDIGLLKTFKPMLAIDYEKRKAKIVWNNEIMIQPKLDGIRCIASRDGLFSRTGKEIVAVPHIAKELEAFFVSYPDVVLDGELYNHALKADFNKIVSLVRKTKPSAENLAETAEMVEYHIYDIADGNTSDQPFRKRNEELDLLFIMREYRKNKLVLVETDFARTEEECDQMHGLYLAAGYEGSIIRLPEPYAKGKRSNALIKRKDFDDEEFKILGYEEGVGNYVGLPKVILIELPDKSVAKATMTGTKEYLQEVKDTFDDYIGKRVTVQYFGWTPDGKLRFPIAKALHKNSRW